MHRARGDEQAWLELTDRARRTIEKEGFGSLYARCPEIRPPSADRIGRAMTAFAAGDAFGVPWEGSGPEAIDADRITDLPAPEWGWPRGSTSDDTAQMLLVCELLADTDGHPTAEAFLARLAAAEDEIRGIGPTTRRALDRFRETGALPEPTPGERATNGAAMRMLPVGWTTPATDDDLRRQLVETLAIGTHRAPEAIAAACLVAAMAAWAIEGVGLESVLVAAETEADWVAGRYAEPAEVRAALAGTWTSPTGASHSTRSGRSPPSSTSFGRRPISDQRYASASSSAATPTRSPPWSAESAARWPPTSSTTFPWLPVVDFDLPADLAERLHRLRVARYNQ